MSWREAPLRRRALRGLAIVALVAACAIAALAARGGPARRRAYPAKLPERPGRSIAERGCLMCHSAMLITQQRKDSTAWEKTVHQMEAWGAPIAPAQHDSLIAYLKQSFGATSSK